MTAKAEISGRETLLEAACQLFLEDGYDAVSMQQIAEAAGMTKGAQNTARERGFTCAQITQQMHG